MREITFMVTVRVDDSVNDSDVEFMVEQAIEDMGGPNSVTGIIKVE